MVCAAVKQSLENVKCGAREWFLVVDDSGDFFVVEQRLSVMCADHLFFVVEVLRCRETESYSGSPVKRTILEQSMQIEYYHHKS